MKNLITSAITLAFSVTSIADDHKPDWAVEIGNAVAQTVWAGRRARGRAWPHLVQPFQVYGQLRADGGQVGCSVGPLAQRVGEVHAD